MVGEWFPPFEATNLEGPTKGDSDSASGRSKGNISAVLVEAQKLYYVYRRTSQGDEFGVQDVVDMDLQSGERVLGARLIELGSVKQGDTANYALMILTQHRLLAHELRI